MKINIDRFRFSKSILSDNWEVSIVKVRESNKGVVTVRKYIFLLANSSHKYIWELHVLAKYGNFVLNNQNFETISYTFLNKYQKSNWFLKKKVIFQNTSQTVLTPAIIRELFAKKSADRPNCHYSFFYFL